MTWPFGDLPRGHYGAILADPPWPFATWSHKGKGRSGEAHYGTMSHEDMEVLPVGDLAAADCLLFMWIVQTQIPQSIRLIESWGFAPKSVAFAWIKGDGLPLFPDDVCDQMGMGYWTRAGFEQCLLGTRGKPQRKSADVRQMIIEKRREHSRKPDCVHERIERLVAGPYLELFARQRRPGWDCWGNETDKFKPVEPEYDGQQDMARSIQEGFAHIRKRKANGGPGWRLSDAVTGVQVSEGNDGTLLSTEATDVETSNEGGNSSDADTRDK